MLRKLFKKQRFNFSKLGFSLAELSLVITILGATGTEQLATSGMVSGAQMQGAFSEIQRYARATEAFVKEYNAYPGDISNFSIYFPGESNGNGDGIINNNEDLLFWRHLSLAGFIEGSYDGTTDAVGQGVPKTPIDNSGLSVSSRNRGSGNNQTVDLILEISNYQDRGNKNARFLASNIQAVDARIDDGRPTRGSVTAIDGDDAGGECLNGTSYNVNSNNLGCVLQIRISLPKPNIVENVDINSCSGSQVGATRHSISELCPEGYTGAIIETCTESQDWKVTERACKPVSCGASGVYQDKRQISCPTGTKGFIEQICNSAGIWTNTTYNCNRVQESCVEPGKTIKDPCPIGQAGRADSECQSSGLYTLLSESCNNIECPSYPGYGTGKIGDIIKTNNQPCPNGYTTQQGENNTTILACTWSGTWQETGTLCVPEASECNYDPNGDNKRTLECPIGYKGKHIQQCFESTDINDPSLWQTIENTCAPVKCGSEPIGSMRISDKKCPSDIGVMLEVCQLNNDGHSASYIYDEKNCIPPTCPADYSGIGNANWEETVGGQLATGECIACHEGNPLRKCDKLGRWEAPSNPCEIEKCPRSSNTQRGGNANWEASAPGVYNTDMPEHECASGFEGRATRECICGKQWQNASESCTPSPCVDDNENGITWNTTDVGQTDTIYNQCPDGKSGYYSRTCFAGPRWGTIADNCNIGSCPAETFGGFEWGETAPGQPATDINQNCATRTCSVAGKWSDNVNSSTCGPAFCVAENFNGHDWTQTEEGQNGYDVANNCAVRKCLPGGTWDTVVNEDGCASGSCPPGWVENTELVEYDKRMKAYWEQIAYSPETNYLEFVENYPSYKHFRPRDMIDKWDEPYCRCKPRQMNGCEAESKGGYNWPEIAMKGNDNMPLYHCMYSIKPYPILHNMFPEVSPYRDYYLSGQENIEPGLYVFAKIYYTQGVPHEEIQEEYFTAETNGRVDGYKQEYKIVEAAWYQTATVARTNGGNAHATDSYRPQATNNGSDSGTIGIVATAGPNGCAKRICMVGNTSENSGYVDWTKTKWDDYIDDIECNVCPAESKDGYNWPAVTINDISKAIDNNNYMLPANSGKSKLVPIPDTDTGCAKRYCVYTGLDGPAMRGGNENITIVNKTGEKYVNIYNTYPYASIMAGWMHEDKSYWVNDDIVKYIDESACGISPAPCTGSGCCPTEESGGYSWIATASGETAKAGPDGCAKRACATIPQYMFPGDLFPSDYITEWGEIDDSACSIPSDINDGCSFETEIIGGKARITKIGINKKPADDIRYVYYFSPGMFNPFNMRIEASGNYDRQVSITSGDTTGRIYNLSNFYPYLNSTSIGPREYLELSAISTMSYGGTPAGERFGIMPTVNNTFPGRIDVEAGQSGFTNAIHANTCNATVILGTAPDAVMHIYWYVYD